MSYDGESDAKGWLHFKNNVQKLIFMSAFSFYLSKVYEKNSKVHYP